jgi:hypothetical protein
MDELRESSLLFSLEGLLETERERVQREAREAQQRRAEELKRVADAAERRRLAQEQEREARERREALQREREQLDQQRLEAMKRATVERARFEAEAGMRLVEAEQQRKHELSLAKLREEQQGLRYRTLSWLSSAALGLAVAGALAAYFGWIRPAHARDEQRWRGLLSESQLREQVAEQALRLERARNRTLSERLRSLEASPPVTPPPKAEPTPIKNVPATHPATPAKRGRCRDTGDPLDDCLH